MAHLKSELTIQVKLQSHVVILFHIFTSWLLQETDFLIGFRCEKSFDFFFFLMANGWRPEAGRGVSMGFISAFLFINKCIPLSL